MTAESQRIAIAEACGWKLDLMTHELALWKGPNGEMVGHGQYPPDYLNDLNAMAEADRYAMASLMDADQWERYGRELERVHPTACLETTRKGNDPAIDYYDFATLMTGLTAAQRAEAFLRTIGKWEEGK